MNFKKMMKRGQEGFTLVELIVVIAILGILAGIGIPAYSGYVEKANKGADQALIGEVQHALALYYYSNPDADLSTAWVKLSQEGANDYAGETGEKAMAAVFGDDWKDTVGLKYADWKASSSTLSYRESSYYGKESGLVKTVDTLTTALGNAVKGNESTQNLVFGGPFGDFLENKNIDTDNGKAIGNAAVLYVAEQTKGKETQIQTAFNNVLGSEGNVTNNTVDNIFTALKDQGFGEVAAVAAIYAYAEGYAQFSGQADAFHEMSFDGITNGAEAAGKLAQNLALLQMDDFKEYVSSNQGAKDLKGYVDMMGTVVDNQDLVSDNLNSDDCFTDGTIENMLKDFAAMSSKEITTVDGQVAVGLSVDANGAVLTPVTPINWNK